MRTLALSDEILMKVDKAARYIGGEVNSVMKDKNDVDIRFAMCFPDVYEIGMSNLGMMILYNMFNEREDVWCERVFSPWMDLDKIMREEHIPLFALESQEPVKEFDFLGITLGYEMCYTNVLQVLDLSHVSLLAKDRKEDDPIVIGGGACAYNPEPIAEFFDMFYIGEGETVYDALFDAYKANKAAGGSRADFLFAASQIPGIYVPSLYNVTYKEDGTIASFTPAKEGVPEKVCKQLITDVTKDYRAIKAPVVPFIKATQDRVTLEIQRGCIRGCRFCQAGMIYRPTRERNVEDLKASAREMLQNTGHEEISLSSLSSSDYSELKELVNFLIEEFHGNAVNISLPSLRIDAFALDVMSKVQDVKKSSLTFAPEAGSQRLRNVINKGLTEEVILHGAGEAFKGGWNQVKLYFMLGLPTETEEDMKGIAHLAQKIAETYYEEVPKEQRKVFYLHRIRCGNNEPMLVEHTYIPYYLCNGIESYDFSSISLYYILDSLYGLEPYHATETIEAVNMTEDERKILRCQENIPAFRIKRISHTETGLIYEYTESTSRSDRNVFQLELYKNQTAGKNPVNIQRNFRRD